MRLVAGTVSSRPRHEAALRRQGSVHGRLDPRQALRSPGKCEELAKVRAHELNVVVDLICDVHDSSGSHPHFLPIASKPAFCKSSGLTRIRNFLMAWSL